jgi:hypothetical protein
MLPNTGYTPVILSPYRKGVCWHEVRAKEKGEPARYCGAGAGKYRLSKSDGFGCMTASPEVEEVWLCYKHCESMRKAGYVLVNVLEG